MAAPSRASSEAEATPPPQRPGSKVLGVAALVAALDQATKEAALRGLADGPVDVIEGAVTLDLSFNTGGVFGIFPGAPTLFAVATALIVVTLLVWSRRITEARWLVPVGMVIGGGIGNLTDRILREGGRVVDFIDLHVWPTFNLADSAIVVGVVLVVWFGARAPKEP